jgi:hypothetical protein
MCIHMYHTQSHMSRRVDWLSWERQIGTKGIISPLVLKKWWVYIWGVLNGRAYISDPCRNVGLGGPCGFFQSMTQRTARTQES